MSAARLAYRRLALALAAALLLPGPGCDRKDGRAPNLLLVSVDTLRADHLGAYGAPPGLTPELDALARESVVYERAFSPASHTLPSIAALLTGREPEEVGVLSNRTVLPQAVPTLATLLWLRGYRTGAVVSSAVLVPEAGFARGFDRYDSSLPQREAIRHVPERLGKDTTDAALELLDELAADEDRPFFLWVHFQDPHGPYTPPPEYAETPRPPVAAPDHPVPLGTDISGLGQIPSYQVLNGSRDPSVYRTAYAGEVRYVDAQIGRLLSGLREREIWNRTAVLITADHGEGLGEGDYWFAHGEYLSEPQVWVPLLLRVPGRKPGRHAGPVGLVDVAPTLLALSGAPPPPRTTGRDLLGPLPPQRQIYQNALAGTLVPRLALIEGEWHYRLSVPRSGRSESLHRFGDPRDRTAEEPERLARLRAALRARRDRLHIDQPPIMRELPNEERAMLRALGYVFED